MKTVKYRHHGVMVYANKEVVGKHRDICLCWSCKAFHPNSVANCPIAEKLYGICVEYNLVTPVTECPVYINIDPKGDEE